MTRYLVSLSVLSAVACGDSTADDPSTATTEADSTGTTATMSTTEADSTGTTTTSASDAESSSTDPTDASETDASTSTAAVDSSSSTDPGSSGSESGDPGVCGDGMLSPGEPCEGDEFNDTCQSIGFTDGVATCTDTCELDISACHICGNGLIEQAEGCDGPLGGQITCATEGFTQGTVSCNADTCELDVSGCTLCGDGVAQGPEACDGVDLLDTTCEGLGFDSGDLGCNPVTCAFDFSGCEGGQYLQDFEGGMMPGEFGGGGNAVWVVDMNVPIAGVYSAHSGAITHSQSSILSLPVDYAIDGTVSFWHAESSEATYDALEFWIDGVMEEEWSGNNAAQMASYPVAAGAHTFEWRYTKDGSINAFSDRVWIDDLALFGGVPN